MKLLLTVAVCLITLLFAGCSAREGSGSPGKNREDTSDVFSSDSDAAPSVYNDPLTEKQWDPADYPDPTLPENMKAGIYYHWEHLEYQMFGDPAEFIPNKVVLLGFNDEENEFEVTVRLPAIYTFGEYNRILYDGGFQELLPAGDAVLCDSFDEDKSFLENGIELCKQRSVDFMLAGADYDMVENNEIRPGSYVERDLFVRCIFGEGMDNLEVVYLVKAGDAQNVLLSFSVSPMADEQAIALYDAIAQSVEGSHS